MTEAADVNVSPAEEAFLTREKLEELAVKFIKEGKDILFSWPEFQVAVARSYLGMGDGRFQKGGKWFEVEVGRVKDGDRLDITMAENKADLGEDTRKSGPSDQKRLKSREIDIQHSEYSVAYSGPPTGSMFYMGPDQPARTGNYVMPANTSSVSQRIQTFLSEMKSF